MKAIKVALLVSLTYSTFSWGANEPQKIAQTFLPRGGQFAELIEADPETGKTVKSAPAVLSGSLISPESKDIVFAYFTKAVDLPARSLFLAVVHQNESGYTKVFEETFFGDRLWVQDFQTMGLQLRRLPGTNTDSVFVITGVGASLGAQLRVLHWSASRGFVNVIGEAPWARRFVLAQEGNEFKIFLSFERYSGDETAPQPLEYKWDKEKFAKTPRTRQPANCPTCSD